MLLSIRVHAWCAQGSEWKYPPYGKKLAVFGNSVRGGLEHDKRTSHWQETEYSATVPEKRKSA